MRTVHRFEFEGTADNFLTLNRDAKVVLVHQKDKKISVWIEFDPSEPQDYGWTLRLFATGDPIQSNGQTLGDWTHKGSCSWNDREFWHLYAQIQYVGT